MSGSGELGYAVYVAAKCRNRGSEVGAACPDDSFAHPLADQRRGGEVRTVGRGAYRVIGFRWQSYREHRRCLPGLLRCRRALFLDVLGCGGGKQFIDLAFGSGCHLGSSRYSRRSEPVVFHAVTPHRSPSMWAAITVMTNPAVGE